MKFTNESLDLLIVTIVGDDVLPLIHILRNKDNVSEFKLAEMLNITVNQTRNMLYRLNEQNLVTFMRKKDKKKGWYIYYWSLNKRSVEESILKVKQKQLEDLKSRLKREQEGIFYVCPNGCMRLPIETAMEYEFKCQECGSLLKDLENQKTISNIQKMIFSLEEEIKLLVIVPVKKAPKKEVKIEVKKVLKKEAKVEVKKVTKVEIKKEIKKPVKKLVKKLVKKISNKKAIKKKL